MIVSGLMETWLYKNNQIIIVCSAFENLIAKFIVFCYILLICDMFVKSQFNRTRVSCN